MHVTHLPSGDVTLTRLSRWLFPVALSQWLFYSQKRLVPAREQLPSAYLRELPESARPAVSPHNNKRLFQSPRPLTIGVCGTTARHWSSPSGHLPTPRRVRAWPGPRPPVPRSQTRTLPRGTHTWPRTELCPPPPNSFVGVLTPSAMTEGFWEVR